MYVDVDVCVWCDVTEGLKLIWMLVMVRTTFVDQTEKMVNLRQGVEIMSKASMDLNLMEREVNQVVLMERNDCWSDDVQREIENDWN